MKIVITNIVALNGGDAAIMQGMVDSFRHVFGNDVEITLCDKNPEVSKTLYPDFKWYETLGLKADRTRFNHIRYLGKIARRINHYRYTIAAKLFENGILPAKYLINRESRKLLKIYNDADVVVSTGGTYLVGTYGVLTQFLDYKIVHNLGKKLVFYTQSVGPFNTKASKEMMTEAFKWAALILLRDKQSENNIRQLNIIPMPKIKIMPDAAFGLGKKDTLIRKSKNRIGMNMKIAISVREWHAFAKKDSVDVMNDYITGIADATVFLIDKGYKIYFFSTCQGITDYDNDNGIVDKVMEKLPVGYENSVIRFFDYLDNDNIRSLLDEMDMIVATRLHMSILALISGTPVFPIAYEFKNVELFKSIGYDEVLKMDDINGKILIEKIETFLSEYDNLMREKVNYKVSELIEKSVESATLLKQALAV